jgi:hypothetical protein
MAILESNSPSFEGALLFTRLPDRIFSPLSSGNRHRYWSLLCHLHERRFGPDAPLPPTKGYPSKIIIQDIVDALDLQDAWEDEESTEVNASSEVRAIAIFNRFNESGWLRIDQPRFDKKVTMQPAVSQFLTMLINFAETGPVFVSGKIRSIDANVQLVLDGKASGDSLSEAAEQARNLLEHVRNTGTNIRELMETLHKNSTTAQYVQRFFSDYIERVFIGDYRELHTSEHPLSKRAQIIGNIENISESESHKTKLIEWYENNLCKGDRKKAERLFERDIYRLSELQRIDEYLDRLDDEIRRANKRALAFLDYRIRSLGSVDVMVNQAIESINKDGLPTIGDPFASGSMLSETNLAEPRKPIERAAPSKLRKVVVSDEQRAKANITRLARTNRMVSPIKLSAYVINQLGNNDEMKSQDIKTDSVASICMYQTLAKLALHANVKSRKLRMDGLTMSKGFRVEGRNEPEVPHEHISSSPFTIKKHTASGKES